MYAEVLRGKCTDVCNVLWNASKKKMDFGWLEQWIDGQVFMRPVW